MNFPYSNNKVSVESESQSQTVDLKLTLLTDISSSEGRNESNEEAIRSYLTVIPLTLHIFPACLLLMAEGRSIGFMLRSPPTRCIHHPADQEFHLIYRVLDDQARFQSLQHTRHIHSLWGIELIHCLVCYRDGSAQCSVEV